MKRIQRLPLSPQAIVFLLKRAREVTSATDPRTEAGRLWDLQDNKAFREIRQALEKMASGLQRCMYCEDSQGTAIDHFWPRSGYPERAFDWLNYLLACSLCNSNFKRDRFPLDAAGQPLLVNPTEEDPLDHLSFSPSTGEYMPRSPKGKASREVFGLDRKVLTMGRFDAWISLQNALIQYAEAKSAGEEQWAGDIATTVLRHPFSGVFAALLHIASGPGADLLIKAECLQALQSHPEILRWT